MKYVIFPCGCKFEPVEPLVEDFIVTDILQPIPKVKLCINNVPKDCSATWDLISCGNTIGQFQLESNLGRHWSKQIKPRSIEELSDIISIIRPGCLECFSGNPPKSATQHYTDRKNGLEIVEPYNTIFDNILKDTQFLMLYQEQSIQIANQIAGFSLESSDVLRRAIGHKDTELMAKLESQFVDGCIKTNIVTKEQAIEIFGWIKASQRYGFNRCISGKTKFYNCNYNNSIQKYKLTVKEMYLIKNDIDYAKYTGNFSFYKQWNRHKDYGFINSMSVDGIIRPNVIKDIRFEGIKPVYKVITKGGNVIECTDNHKFPTQRGILELSDINIGDFLHVINSDNITTRLSSIVSIEYVGEEEVFDVEMEGPNHNFVTDTGIITCNSHGIAYAIDSYWTAYCKTHFPIQFYCSYLHGANWKQKPLEEIKILVNDAKKMNIEVLPPDVRDGKPHFYIYNQKIHFGFADIKGVGDAAAKTLTELLSKHPRLKEYSWLDFLIKLGNNINRTVCTALISTGGCDFFRLSRARMLYELELFYNLSVKELETLSSISHTCKTLGELFTLYGKTRKTGGICHSEKRAGILQKLAISADNPPHSLIDNPIVISQMEEKLLGISLTANKVEGCADAANATHSVKQFSESTEEIGILAVELTKIKPTVTKRGKNPGESMGFVDIVDVTGSIDHSVCFPSVWSDYENLLYEGNTVLLQLSRNMKQEGFIVQKLWQI